MYGLYLSIFVDGALVVGFSSLSSSFLSFSHFWQITKSQFFLVHCNVNFPARLGALGNPNFMGVHNPGVLGYSSTHKFISFTRLTHLSRWFLALQLDFLSR